MSQLEEDPRQLNRPRIHALRSRIGGGLCAILLGACGSLPTTMNSLPIPPDTAGLQSDPLPSPLPTSPLSLTPKLRQQLGIPSDQPVLLIERRGEDVVAQIPADEVIRWIGGGEQWPGIEGIDLGLTVDEGYRETATAQLRLEQTASFTFSAPPSGSMTFEATAFSGLTTLAAGRIRFDSAVLDSSSEDSETPPIVPLLLEPAEDVPFLQGLSLGPGEPISFQTGVVQDALLPNQTLLLTGQHLDQAAEVLFATVLNPSGMTTRSGQILERSSDSLRIRPPQGIALTSTTLAVRSEAGLGLGTLNVTWRPDAGPSPASAPTSTPTPTISWQVESTASPLTDEISLQDPSGVIMDATDHLLLTDQARHQIMLLDPEQNLQVWAGLGESGQADGTRQQAQFDTPTDLAWGTAGELWVVDQGNHQIRQITPQGQVITVAGTGEAGFRESEDPLQAQFDRPSAIAVAGDGSLFVADSGNHRIRQILPTGEVLTLAGTGDPGTTDGPGERAQFHTPVDLTLDATGHLWIADRDNHRIRQLTPEGQVSTVTGSTAGFVDGDLDGVRFNHPTALAWTRDGALLIADRDNHRIRRLTGVIVSTLAGNGQSGSRDGTAAQAQFRGPLDLWVAADGSIWVVDQGSPRLRRIMPIPATPPREQLSQTP